MTPFVFFFNMIKLIIFSIFMTTALFAASQNGAEQAILNLMIEKNRGNKYADLAARQRPQDVAVRPVNLPWSFGVKIYECIVMIPGFDSGFSFYTNPVGSDAVVLTRSIRGIEELIKALDYSRFSDSDIINIASSCMNLYEPWTTSFTLLEEKERSRLLNTSNPALATVAKDSAVVFDGGAG